MLAPRQWQCVSGACACAGGGGGGRCWWWCALSHVHVIHVATRNGVNCPTATRVTADAMTRWEGTPGTPDARDRAATAGSSTFLLRDTRRAQRRSASARAARERGRTRRSPWAAVAANLWPSVDSQDRAEHHPPNAHSATRARVPADTVERSSRKSPAQTAGIAAGRPQNTHEKGSGVSREPAYAQWTR